MEKSSVSETTLTPSAPGVTTNTHLDSAYNFIQNTNTASLEPGDVDIRAVRRKVDFRLIPIMFLVYGMQFLDKVNINVRLISLRCGLPLVESMCIVRRCHGIQPRLAPEGK